MGTRCLCIEECRVSVLDELLQLLTSTVVCSESAPRSFQTTLLLCWGAGQNLRQGLYH